MKELVKVRRPNLAIDFTMDLNDSFIPDSNTRKYTNMYGAAEPGVISAFGMILKEGDIVIDGGANIGYHSLIMAALVRLSGKVLAFEPGPNNLPKLKENVAINRATQVQVIDQPLWSSCEEVTLHMCVDSGQHSLRAHQTHGTQKMMATTIDTWKVSPKLIKLDIEGSEFEALVGGTETIKWCQPYIVCELNGNILKYFGKTTMDVRRYAKDQFGYDTFCLSDNVRYPMFIPPRTELKTELLNVNVLLATMDMVSSVWPQFICD